MPIEYEAKFLGIDHAAFAVTLAQAGYECVMPNFLFRRQVFNLPNEGIGKWGRVRWERDVINLSVKHVVDVNAVDGTHEYLINIPINDNPAKQYDDAIAFMLACGLTRAGAQENYRETWVKNGVEICIDRWPSRKSCVEVEAADEASVRNAFAELGLDFNTAIFGGITSVYQAEMGILPEDFEKIAVVTFDQPPQAVKR